MPKINPLITSSNDLVTEMTLKTANISSYWNEFGQLDFQQKCENWIKDMGKFKSMLESLQSSVNSIAVTLQAEEIRIEEARQAQLRREAAEREASARRQAAEREASAKVAAGNKIVK
ncbi:hypothetical protein EHS13_30095 [Paenibacillus psychroresistens]|uniref:WXG100 family type VII secretion target n=1 Tax=Paenibacillus psychroresistens TaxID=1778678 RepID=A0A6B8RSB1_9BACL|nr:hypothetical protein [Paenibacillus psychroresistens]QGQ98829.1 hypothetical protein EHS13_30095 [Paenibacillus psychroresistens]